MYAIGLTRHGAPEVLERVDLPTPHAGPGQVRIQVQAAAVNPVDAIIRSGAFAGMTASDTEPIVPGMDVAGVIDEVGHDLPAGCAFAVGDEVVGFVVPSGAHGGYSEYVVLPAESVAGKPAGLDAAHAAAFLSNALTAEIALEALALPEGSTIAVTGAAGAVGGYLVQLAAGRGLRVLADAAPQDEALVRSFGAEALLRRGDDFVEDVRNATGGAGADAVADAAVAGDHVLDAVRDGGWIATFLPTETEPDRGIRAFRSFVMRSNLRHDAIEKVARLVEAGSLSTRVAAVLPAEEAAAAHHRLEEGGVRGRIILEL